MIYRGWGRKLSGYRAIILAYILKSKFVLMEDGFIRSCGLGESPSFSFVEDDIGIYYDANRPSKLEELCNNFDFKNNIQLLTLSKQAIDLIRINKISKYNISDENVANDLGDKDNNILIKFIDCGNHK